MRQGLDADGVPRRPSSRPIKKRAADKPRKAESSSFTALDWHVNRQVKASASIQSLLLFAGIDRIALTRSAGSLQSAVRKACASHRRPFWKPDRLVQRGPFMPTASLTATSTPAPPRTVCERTSGCPPVDSTKTLVGDIVVRRPAGGDDDGHARRDIRTRNSISLLVGIPVQEGLRFVEQQADPVAWRSPARSRFAAGSRPAAFPRHCRRAACHSPPADGEWHPRRRLTGIAQRMRHRPTAPSPNRVMLSRIDPLNMIGLSRRHNRSGLQARNADAGRRIDAAHRDTVPAGRRFLRPRSGRSRPT